MKKGTIDRIKEMAKEAGVNVNEKQIKELSDQLSGLDMKVFSSIRNMMEMLSESESEEKAFTDHNVLVKIAQMKEGGNSRMIIKDGDSCETTKDIKINKDSEGWNFIVKEKHLACGKGLCHVLAVTIKNTEKKEEEKEDDFEIEFDN